jgi:acylphosphatase
MKRLTANIQGRVQGVSYRYYTQRTAQRLGLKGWVRNEHDGSVAVVAEGAETALKQLLEFLRNGSPAAQVHSVKFDWQDANNEFDRFEIRTWDWGGR